MAGASDKARFYLEQYVPELREYERKQLFTSTEISAIARKRSDFEHILNARGSTPADYARYATYEMNLDSLRKKRCKRLGVKSSPEMGGQRTVFFILDRATRKFPGDMGLWMQYVRFCQREKAGKKLAKVFTSVLRLRPREWGLWVEAAKHYSEVEGDMRTARAYLQRGLRFCKDEVRLWLEYMRLEMVYLAKVAARRKILGLDETERKEVQQDEDGDMLLLPSITAEDMNPDSSRPVDAVTLQKLASAPAFTGAIPIAIFDAAMKQFDDNSEVAGQFFDVVALFDQTSAATNIIQHILDFLQTTAPTSPERVICEARQPLIGISATSVEFPSALGTSLAKLKIGLDSIPAKSQARLHALALVTLLPYVRQELDDDVATVLRASVRRHYRVLAAEERRKVVGGDPEAVMTAVAARLKRLRSHAEEEGVDRDVLMDICGNVEVG